MEKFRAIPAVLAIIGLCLLGFAEETDPNDITAYYGFGEIEIIKLDWGIDELQTGDFNGDGKCDIAVVNNIKAKIELLLQKAESGIEEDSVTVAKEDENINILNPPSLYKKEAIAVSQKIFSLATGDLNSDGMVDFAFYGDPRGLYVLFQKDGEEQGQELNWRHKKINIDDALVTAGALICADLNSDGKDDLALAARDSVYVIIQEDGALTEPVKYPTITQPRELYAADINGDKINDLVILAADTEKPIHVRFGQSGGQLGPEEQFFVEDPFILRLHNIDDSSRDEVLVIDQKGGRLIAYQLAEQKDKDADWPIYFYPLVSGQANSKRDLVTGDFDGDGLSDIVISEPDGAELILYKQVKGTGLAKPVTFPALSDIDNLSAADIDGDGKTDIAAISVKEKIIGISKFEKDRLIFPEPLSIAGEPLAMELADVDGDKKTDCAYIYKDSNDIRHLGVTYSLNKNKADDVSSLPLEKLAANPEGLLIADVDQDGLNDILIFIEYENPILVKQNKKRLFSIFDSSASQASLIKEAKQRSVAVADIDGKKGKELVIAQDNFARSLTLDDGKVWKIIDQYNAKSTENNISSLAVVQSSTSKQPVIIFLDGQKGQLQMLKADEDKTYRFENQIPVGKWNSVQNLKCIFDTFTGDNAENILLFDSEKFAIVTPPTAGSKPKYLEQIFSYETKIREGYYGNIAIGDINSDGKVDIVMVEWKKNHFEILALDAENNPLPAMRFKIFEEKSYDQEGGKASVEPREIKIADVTNDGKNDLITVIHDRIIIYPQD
ncbi:MAG: VCBS repeat-containing protein [Phycisphaerae bacterium]|nr:VCBS repeat-containing protein [Phycisphaerae bacterium]